tara:strand:+ start:607 stop:2298 length:1692 start_codon:yes stop_codon:yes gene_type:complete
MRNLLVVLFLLSTELESSIFNSNSIVHPQVSSQGMVVSQHYLATNIGKSILEDGGNAYDASIAVAFALAVVLPRAGNIGGGGFTVIYDKETNSKISIDYREKAPALASKDMYLNLDGSVNKERAREGILSIGVPGTVYGMWEIHKKFGTLPWKQLINPAIELAKNGFIMSPFMVDALNKRNKKLSKYKNFKEIFYKENLVLINTKLVQQDLAQSLTLIADEGIKTFYEGQIAENIVKHMKENNGLISIEDLNNYRPVWREPISGSFNDFEIITMGPPSSGGIHIIQMLNILEQFELKKMGHNSVTYAALLSEVMKYAYADRSKYLGDPDFYEVPTKRLISKDYANDIFKMVQLNKTTPSNQISPGNLVPYESDDTTHFSIADKFGNIVSNTYTLNSSYGSGVVISGTGIIMNNEMDDFVSAPGVPNQFGLLGGEANKIEPFKRPLSSMTPTIVFKNGKPAYVTGSPGGSVIITAVLQFLLNTLVFDMEISDATVAPRVHQQWDPDVLFVEKGFDINHVEELNLMGQKTIVTGPRTALESINIKNNLFYGFGDTRRPDSSANGP